MANEWALSDHFQVQQIELEQVLETANALLEGKHVGRTIVALGGTNQ
jgi:hypothetical protein